MNKELVIFGSGGHAISVSNVALSMGYKIKFFISPDKKRSLFDRPVIIFEEYLSLNSKDDIFAIAIGDNAKRQALVKTLKNQIPSAEFPSLIHPSSSVGQNSFLGMGSIVMPHVNVGPYSRIGSFCILNSSSSIDHECSLGNYTSIAPGVILGGKVQVNERSAVMIGAKIAHNIKVGSDVVIGANSFVNSDLEDNLLVYGTPAKKIRIRKKGESYL